MKKRLIFLAAMLLSAAMLTGCTAVAIVEDGCFEYGEVAHPEEYFVISYFWDGDPESMDIYIPETYNDLPVTGMGGYYGRGYPCPFSIYLPEEYTARCGEDTVLGEFSTEYVTDTDYETYHFTIHIGKNIQDFYDKTLLGDTDTSIYYGIESEDGTEQDIFYKIEYEYLIDAENDYLQVVDGFVCEK